MTDPTNGIEVFVRHQAGVDGMAVEFVRSNGGVRERAVGVGMLGLEWVPIREVSSWADEPLAAIRLNRFEFNALRQALVEEYDPPTESKALREALAIERARVEKIVDRAVMVMFP